MQIKGLPWTMVQGSRRLDVELSDAAKQRWRALRVFEQTRDWRLVRETFGISRATLYRWRKQYDPKDWTTLEERSRRPRRVRKPRWTAELTGEVLKLREQYPSWGKNKLVVLLRKGGFDTSASTVGRILFSLRKRGVLQDPPRQRISVRKKCRPRPYACRKPKNYLPTRPGELVEIDTMDIKPLPNVQLKHFSARDVVSKWDVVEVHRRATSTAARLFLETVTKRMPFPVKAVQVDGGSEFKAVFEKRCEELGIPLYVLPPRSPKLNANVERAHRTHLEEFYEITPDCPWNVAELNQRLKEWELVYNNTRPHQSLNFLTPSEFLATHPP
jgi:transposase InsO family protein